MICQTVSKSKYILIHTKEAIEKLALHVNSESCLVLESILRENEELKNRVQDLEGMIDECFQWGL